MGTEAMTTDTKAHECRESRACCCSMGALEPADACPIHGCGEWPPRCETCGKFLPWAVRVIEEEAKL